MRNLYFFLTAFALSLTLQAQIIDIPDANFKAALIADGVDTNNDGEIQVNEAEAVTNISIAGQGISSLVGIEYFINLVEIACHNNNLTTLNLSQNTQLTNIRCSSNQLSSFEFISSNLLESLNLGNNNLTTVDLSGYPNLISFTVIHNNLSNLDISQNLLLETLSCGGNQFSSLDLSQHIQLVKLNISYGEFNSIDLSQNTNLDELNISNNNFSTINLSNNLNLRTLDCSNNNLTELNINELTNLESLDCGNNQLSLLDVSNLSNLYYLGCYINQISDLNLGNSQYLSQLECYSNQLTTLDFSGYPYMFELYCSENQITSLDFSEHLTEIEFLEAFNNPINSLFLKNNIQEFNPQNYEQYLFGINTVTYICADENEFDSINSILTNQGYSETDYFINSYCSFTPGGDYYTVVGNINIDTDDNGCDNNDPFYPNLNFAISNGMVTGNFISNSSGSYSIPVQEGAHTITPELENPTYFTVSPTSITVDFPTDASPYTQDFCVTANDTYHDLEVSILPIEAARPGFDADYKVVYKNKGTSTLSGTIQLGFQDDIMDLVSATPPNESGVSDLLSWSFIDLTPLEVREIDFTMNINSPMETPPVNGDDILTYTASISSSETDETPNDNLFTLTQTVVNSFDPNDKTCLQGDVISPEMVGEFVHYMIRFENTGTANAINVVVKDVIDTSKLDLSTLLPLRASHDFFARIENNYIEFIFEDINLPFDDANNDGYVIFKIKTLETLQVGDTFENNAEVYFDFNFPIITNTTQTSVQTLSIADESFDVTMMVYPNPSSDVVTIETNYPIETITLYDAMGRIVQEIKLLGNKNTFTLNTKNLAKGNYFIKVDSNSKTSVKKLLVL